MAVDMSDEPASESQHWRNRAKAVRERAKQVKNNRSKRILLGLADTYERVADQIEERLRIMGKGALWPSRENYTRFREIMDDGNKFPQSFDEWR
jgi:hypothetical protein